MEKIVSMKFIFTTPSNFLKKCLEVNIYYLETRTE